MSGTTVAHQCDETCVCPVHGTALIYSPALDDHACQDVSCKYGHGGAPDAFLVPIRRRVEPGELDGAGAAAERERIKAAGAVSACCGASYARQPGRYGRWSCDRCGKECDLIGVIA